MIPPKNFWASNLQYLRKRKKLSQEELAKQAGITRTKLNALENGNTKNPTVSDLIAFSEFFRISIDTMLRAELSKLSAMKMRELETGHDAYATGTKIRVLATTVNSENQDNIELVPVKARAGYTTGYGDPDFIARLPLFHLPNLPKDRKYRMFPTAGDSMLPVPEGAFVIGEFAEDWLSLKDGMPCIVVTRSEGIVFKLVYVNKKGKALELHSLNTLYAPYTVLLRDVLEVWCFRSFISDALPEGGADLEGISRAVRAVHADVKVILRKKG